VGGIRDKGERRTGEALLGAEEVTGYLGVGRVTVYRWCKEGRIPCLKVGKL
jgi:excisionase family DNA binding protein